MSLFDLTVAVAVAGRASTAARITWSEGGLTRIPHYCKPHVESKLFKPDSRLSLLPLAA
jgi:hypothetical protein